MPAIAQDSTRHGKTSTTTERAYRPQRVYLTWGGDGALLSFARMQEGGQHVRNIPRFSAFFHLGQNINYNFNHHFGVFTGFSIKNIGLINDANDSVRLKRRVYTLGIPVGFKIGNLRRYGLFFFAGGAYDLAFNYKEKQFLNGRKQHKFNQWFSDRTPLLMPSFFAGFRASPGFGVKVQYYPNNFFNQEYTKGNTAPYRDLEAKLFFVTLSYDFTRIDLKHRHHRKSHYFF